MKRVDINDTTERGENPSEYRIYAVKAEGKQVEN